MKNTRNIMRVILFWQSVEAVYFRKLDKVGINAKEVV